MCVRLSVMFGSTMSQLVNSFDMEHIINVRVTGMVILVSEKSRRSKIIKINMKEIQDIRVFCSI